MSEFGIHFGALAPPISEQLKQQGLRFNSDDDARRLERAATSITYLAVHGLLSDTEKDKAHKRLIKKIAAKITTPA